MNYYNEITINLFTSLNGIGWLWAEYRVGDLLKAPESLMNGNSSSWLLMFLSYVVDYERRSVKLNVMESKLQRT